MYVFDLDGTLVDTREAVRQAYAHVGVTMPEDAWGKPWREWLFDGELHHRKNQVYPEMLRKYAKTLPLFEYVVATKAPILTGASKQAARAIAARFCRHLHDLNVQVVECSTAEKALWLKKYAFQSSIVQSVYVDDDEATRSALCGIGWNIVSPEDAIALLSIEVKA